ncbi:hypothetical protein J132_00900 [Termitomyces sp. J132]|nr:hypothetical protein J132_00900 [Termitomyces sp. J132]
MLHLLKNMKPMKGNWMKDLSVYPQMFLWLFPYGLGGPGCGNSKISVKAHKSRLLMYHDK